MTTEIPIMPLHTVLYPGMPMPLVIFEDRYRRMLDDLCAGEGVFGVSLIQEGQEVGGPAVPRTVGTTTAILRQADAGPEGIHLVTVGQQRFRLLDIIREEPYIVGCVELLAEQEHGTGSRELIEELKELFQEHLALLLQLLGQPEREIEVPENAARLSYMIAAHLTGPLEVRQELLEMDSADERLLHERELLGQEGANYRLLLASRDKQQTREEHPGSPFSLS